MKNLYSFRIIKTIVLFLLLFIVTLNTSAQTPQYYYSNALSQTNSFPFNIAAGKEVQCLYLAGDFANPTPAPAGNIVNISFLMAANLGPYTYTNKEIKLGQTNITEFEAGVWFSGPLTSVYSRSLEVYSANAGQWLTIPLDTPFPYDPALSLIVDVKQCGAPGATGFSSAVTANTGFRRNTSLTGQSCPLPWGQQSGTLNNIGFSLAGPSCVYTWSNQIPGTAASLYSVKAVSKLVGWTGGTNETVRKTTDGGITWINGNPNPGVINGTVFNINAIDANTAVCTTSPLDAYIYKTTNGGANWMQVFTQPGGFINAIEFINSNTCFAQGDPVGGRWSLWKSTDAGSTWDSSGLYLPQTGAEAGWINSMNSVGNNIWFGTNNTKTYRSTNLGANWTSGVTGTLLNSYAIHYNTSGNGLAGGTNIVKSTDGGLTYISTGNAPGTGNINGIQGKDNDFWYIRGNGVYKSSDGGSNWNQVFTTLTGSANDISFTENNGCLTGWVLTSSGSIAKMHEPIIGISNNVSQNSNSYNLNQNYPNPFNPFTNISFSIPVSGLVEIKVYDILGKEIRTLIKDFRQAGSYNVNFDASVLNSGVYFYKLSSGDFIETRNMVLIK